MEREEIKSIDKEQFTNTNLKSVKFTSLGSAELLNLRTLEPVNLDDYGMSESDVTFVWHNPK